MEATSNLPNGMDMFFTQLKRSGRLVDKFYTPVLCSFGALGNILSLIVFCHDTKFKGQSSSYYLGALALSDTGFLLNLFVFWLEDVLQVGIITNPIMCPMVMYIGQVTCFTSVFLMVAFSVERFVAVEYPFYRLKYCTSEVSRKVMFSIVSVALILFSYAWFIAQVIEKNPPITNSLNFSLSLLNISSENLSFFELFELYNDTIFMPSQPSIYRCSVPKQYYKFSEIANYLDTVITLLIPVVLIACLNIRIWYSVGKIMRERNYIVANGRRTTSLLKMEDARRKSSITIQSTHNKQWEVRTEKNEEGLGIPEIPGESTAQTSGKSESRTCQILQEHHRGKKDESNWEMKVTKTLLVVSTVFICLNLPLHTIRCAQFITYMRGITSGKRLLQALEPWGNILFNTNFAVNFILYYTTGSNFRETLKQFLPLARFRRKRKPRVNLSRHRSSYRNYTVERNKGDGQIQTQRNSSLTTVKTTASKNLRKENVIEISNSKLTVDIHRTAKECGETVNI